MVLSLVPDIRVGGVLSFKIVQFFSGSSVFTVVVIFSIVFKFGGGPNVLGEEPQDSRSSSSSLSSWLPLAGGWLLLLPVVASSLWL